MPHDHSAAGRHRRPLAITLMLTSGFLVAEVIGGLVAGSLALLADAGHMLTDGGRLALALFAIWFAARPATPERTYGLLPGGDPGRADERRDFAIGHVTVQLESPGWEQAETHL